jgi:hypothetical protein
MTKTSTANPRFDATEGPGLARLRASPKAVQIRDAVLADQNRARKEARAKVAAGRKAKTQPAAKARPAPHSASRAAIAPTSIPTPAETMRGMSRANAARYMAAAQGVMPVPPDFSAAAYSTSRRRLADMMALVAAGDATVANAAGGSAPVDSAATQR